MDEINLRLQSAGIRENEAREMLRELLRMGLKMRALQKGWPNHPQTKGKMGMLEDSKQAEREFDNMLEMFRKASI